MWKYKTEVYLVPSFFYYVIQQVKRFLISLKFLMHCTVYIYQKQNINHFYFKVEIHEKILILKMASIRDDLTQSLHTYHTLRVIDCFHYYTPRDSSMCLGLIFSNHAQTDKKLLCSHISCSKWIRGSLTQTEQATTI